jgi:hypothetical protein
MDKYILFLLGIIVGIISVYLGILLKNKCIVKTNNFENILKILVRQASRWSTAAKQDKSPLISVLHSNYGAGYLWAIKDIANTEQIQIATGVDLSRLERDIITIQDSSTKKLISVCPDFAPEKSYLSKIAGEG